MQTTRQWQIDAIGPDRRLTIGERTLEPLSGNKVLVRTEAVSLNFRDRLVLESGMGLPLQFPFVPASDMAGIVEAVGPDVTRFRPGDRVISTFSPDWVDGRGLGDARTPLTRHAAAFIRASFPSTPCFPRNGMCARLTRWMRVRRAPCPAPG